MRNHTSSVVLPTFRLTLLLVLVMAAVGPMPMTLHASQALPGGSVEVVRAAMPVAEPAPEDWWAQAQAQIIRSEYHVTWQDTSAIPGAEPSYQAPNRAQDLRFYFYPGGLKAIRRTEGEPSWVWGLAPSGLGSEGGTSTVQAVGLEVDGNQIAYYRGVWTEQYTNNPGGLEQSFVVARPVSSNGSAELTLDLAVSGDLTAHRAGGHAFEFRHDGEKVLVYGGVAVLDAAGLQLQPRIEWLSPAGGSARGGLLRIRFDAEGATYPIQIGARITGLSETADWSATAPPADEFGKSVATAGDVNGDGYSDVIVGAPTYDGGQTDEGAAFVWYGGNGGLGANGTLANADWSDESDLEFAGYGSAVATAGDVNGDGYSDVIIGAPYGHSNQGSFYVYHGSSNGLEQTAVWEDQHCFYNESWCGAAVGTAGDVDGDGYSEIIVGAPNYSGSKTSQGKIYVFHGSMNGLVWTATPWMVEGDQDYTFLGESVATAGDINGDGYADMIVGAPNKNKVFVFHGSSAGLAATANWKASIAQPGADFGESVGTAGDLNGDGYSDVLVGAPGYNQDSDGGRVWIWHGGQSGLGPDGTSGNANWSVGGEQAYSDFGKSVHTAGDVNGDGFADIVVGAPDYDLTTGGDEGQVYVYYGSVTSGFGSDPRTPWTAQGSQVGDQFGTTVATAGDIDGDGYSDILASTLGKVSVFLGEPGGMITISPGVYHPSPITDGRFGWSVASAGDVNGDGLGDLIIGAPGYDSGSKGGAAFVYLVGVWPIWKATGDVADGQFGYSVGTAGDIDGDGYSDIIVGAPYYTRGQSEEGAAFVWYGSSSGLGADGTPSNAGWRIESHQVEAHLGMSVGTAGDVNGTGYGGGSGDGYADIVVGVPHYDAGDTDEGAVFVWHGKSGRLGAQNTPATADWHDEGDAANANLGWSVGTAGDVNRDGYSDLIAGGANFATVWHGSDNGLRASGTDWFKPGLKATDMFGYSVGTAGDVNGDGYSDVIVGAPLHTNTQNLEGGAWAFCGSASGLPTNACWSDTGGKASASFGWSVGTAGDLNGDGIADIISGAPGWSNGQTAEGQARVYYGSDLGPISYNGGDWTVEGSDLWVFPSDTEQSHLGYSVSTAGDTTGSGYAAVLIGAPHYAGSNSSDGFVTGHFGNGWGGVALQPRQLDAFTDAPVAPLGLCESQLSVNLVITGTSPTGRGKVKLEWEVNDLATPFNGASSTSASWSDTGVNGVELKETATNLGVGGSYHWRVRLVYSAVTNPFNPPNGRWVHMPWNGWNEADLRTPGGAGGGGYYYTHLPYVTRDDE